MELSIYQATLAARLVTAYKAFVLARNKAKENDVILVMDPQDQDDSKDLRQRIEAQNEEIERLNTENARLVNEVNVRINSSQENYELRRQRDDLQGELQNLRSNTKADKFLSSMSSHGTANGQVSEIIELLKQPSIIPAIKAVREATGLGLAASKLLADLLKTSTYVK